MSFAMRPWMHTTLDLLFAWSYAGWDAREALLISAQLTLDRREVMCRIPSTLVYDPMDSFNDWTDDHLRRHRAHEQ